ncbi:hypothetical protein CFBP5875_04615 [Agrobacterium pusense]|uniref:hypothetical protein n=1 Tax=Agrobacterium pusense TaxID=648995 RepID=UPI0010BE9D10|nr:hypothetical protein [Agrobacterium pusense]QCL83901.1 hypothetical protein CFBP5875_04615 [Agrobacterium pusense]
MTTEQFELPPAEVKLPVVSKAILGGAAIFTVAWLIAAGVIASAPTPPDAKPLALNEWGDFVAGVSAPIAFVWLVVAVALQSIELREQRKELALTRAEFKSNRAVMTAQADEAKRQAEFIEQQTNLLMDGKADREAQSVFDASIDLIATRLRQYPNAWHAIMVEGYNDKGEPWGSERVLRSGKFSDMTEDFIIAKTAQGVRNNLREVRREHADKVFQMKYPYDFQRLYNAVIAGSDRIATLPETYRIKADTLEVGELREHLIYIADHSGSKPFSPITSDETARRL